MLTDVLIVGGGFGGCYALHKFRKIGFSVQLLEAGSDFGGVWHWNRYPGARVDSEMPLYQFSIPEVWDTWNPTERFPDHHEIRRYFQHVDKVLNLRKDAIFDTIVDGVSYDNGIWTANTTDGRIYKAKYLMLATGSSYKHHFPAFEGLDKYGGTLIHSAKYPATGIDVEGKRVAVIGNGATGVQIIQEMSKKSCNLTAFIRTACIALPMRQRKLQKDETDAQKAFYDSIFAEAKRSWGGFPYNVPTQSILSVSKEERDARLEHLYNQSGFYFFTSSYNDLLFSKEANSLFYDFWAKKTRARVTDPIKREIVVPSKQQYFVATKRLTLEQDYYESIDRPNVEVVDLNKTPIIEFTQDGIVTDQIHKFDVVIMATGFDSLTGSMTDLNIIDKNGVNVKEKWKDGVSTYLGIMVPDMPNMFMVYGPQAPTSLANGPPFIEMQVDWIADALQRMQAEGVDSIEAQKGAANEWRDVIQASCSKTLFPTAKSWYFGANIPGKIREPLLYFGGLKNYRNLLDETLREWKGLNVSRVNVSD